MADNPEFETELPRANAAPRVARLALRSWCADRIDGHRVADAELLVSELAANALRHGQGRITLRASLDQDRLLVEVVDEGSGFQRELGERGLKHVGGWGLDLVEHLSSRWGVREGTTHVWFELELPGPRLSEPEHQADDTYETSDKTRVLQI